MGQTSIALLFRDRITVLNGESFSLPFTATRKLLPRYELSELTDLRVAVVPAGAARERKSRAAFQYEYEIDIGVQKKTTTRKLMSRR